MPIGIVSSVDGKKVDVILSEDGVCKSCGGRGLCSLKKCSIYRCHCEQSVSVGDTVEITMGTHSFLTTALLCYGIPLILLLIVVFWLGSFLSSEWQLGLIAIGVCCLWFVVLGLCKKWIKVQVTCQKIEEGR